MANTEKKDEVVAVELAVMEKAVVARGRTVHTQKEKFSEGGEPVLYGEGEIVELPEAEVARLRKRGFLVSPAVEQVVQTGPKLTGGQVSVTKSV